MAKDNKVKKIKKIKDEVQANKFLVVTGKILYAILFIFTVLILLVVLMQRFSNNTLTFGGYRMFNIISESMIPKYQIGDILLSKETKPNEIKVGDDITYLGNSGNFEGRIVTHQVISVTQKDGKYVFQTKGIANDIADPEITQDQVYGKVIYRFLSLSFIGKITSNIYGFYILIFIPLSILIALKIREIVLNMRAEDEEDSEQERKERIEKIKMEKKENKKNEKN